jgi:hypothetical protein
MTTSLHKLAPDLVKIARALARNFPPEAIKIYRYNSASIRVRVIDERFLGRSIVDRENEVLPLIRQLPEDIQAQITVLLLLAPSETAESFMNVEFEDPTPSRL